MKNGWDYKTIGEVCDLATGGTPSRSRPEYFGGEIKWLVSGDIHNREIFDCQGRITKAGLENSNARLLPVDSVMIALNGQGKTRATVALLRTEATCNQSLVSIAPKNKKTLLPEYLFHNLNGRYDEIRKMTGDDGNDRRGLNMPIIRSIRIPIPPIAEQRRIVAVLDEAFADIDKAKANTEKNIQNARELFDSYLNNIFSNPAPDWEERTFGECFRLKSGDGLTSKMMVPGPFSVYGGNGISGTHNHFNLEGSNVVIGRVGALCGNVRNINDRIWLTDNAFRISEYKFNFHHQFLTYLLNFKDLRSRARQSAQPVISNSSLADLELAFPSSVEKQGEIVKEIEALSSHTSALESNYRRQLDKLNETRKALLQKAFSGTLEN